MTLNIRRDLKRYLTLEDNMTSKKFSVFLIIIACALAIFVVACAKDTSRDTTNTPEIMTSNDASSTNFGNLTASQKLLKFNNVDELNIFISQSSNAQNPSESAGIGRGAMTATVNKLASTVSSPGVDSYTNPGSSQNTASDYSQTNIQVAGVDEADYVKNDGKYIYIIANNSLIIFDALDAKNAKIISQINFGSTTDYCGPQAKEMFVSNNTLVLLTNNCEKTFYFEKYNIVPIPTTKQKTLAYFYDINDRAHPQLVQTFSITGDYYSSRMIGNFIYILTQDPTNNIRYIDGPVIKSTGTKTSQIMKPDIYYFDNPDQNYNLNTVTSIDLSTATISDAKTFLLGYANTIMVSENNVYIAYQKQNYWCWGFMRCNSYDNSEKERFYKVIVPLLKGDIKNEVDNIIQKSVSDDEKWSEISSAFASFYSDIENNETQKNLYESMFQDIEAALNKYDAEKALNDSVTTIHRINIDNGKIEYGAKGEVKGNLLNQFSMDENNRNLRVATTINAWFRNGRINYNNVYVLNSDMSVVGSIEHIAENESIQSTRFIGDKLFMVTFKNIDPFIVVDLKNPQNPKLLGELKIPGYSTYLHPYDENHIIGIGKSTGQNEWGGASITGVKISLYDVSDFSNPKEVDSYQIGKEGTDSPALYDHRAFLFSPTKNIVVLPVSEISNKYPTSPYNYRYSVWNGAYVFNVSTSGFHLLGKIEHSSADTQYYSWFDQASVMRSLYMDNNLYTISNKYIKINDLFNNLDSINTLKLPYDVPYTDYYPVLY